MENDNNNDKGNNRDPQDRREVQRRLRLARVEQQQQQQQRGGARLRAARRSSAEGGDGVDPRPEDAPSSMGRRNREAAVAPAVAAAAAAADPPAAVAAASNNEQGGGDANDNDNSSRELRELVQHLREFCQDGDRKSPHASAINMEKARNVLEACAGNVPLAGQLYWDDYFATQQQHQPQQQQQPDLPPLDAPSAAAAEPAAAAADPAEEERRVRRRLESDFERLLPAPQAAENVNLNPPPPEPVRPPRRRRRRRRGPDAEGEPGILAAAAAARNININRHNVLEDVPMEDAEPVARPAARQPAAQRPEDAQALFVAARAVLGAGEDVAEGSVSVSDDEAGVAGVLRLVRESGRVRNRGRRRRRSASFDDENLDLMRARSALSQMQAAEDADRMEVEPTKKRKQVGAAGAGAGGGDGGDDDSSDGEDSRADNDDDDEEAYLSDNDWLFTASSRVVPVPVSAAASTSQPTEHFRPPLTVLWNGLTSAPVPDDAKKPSKNDDSKQGKADTEVSGRKEKAGKKIKDEPGADKAKDDDDDDNDPQPVPGATKRPEIPSTWLHASFSPHSTAMGLAIKDPKSEDVHEHSHLMLGIGDGAAASNARRNNTIPLPYHCGGVTAVLSIVTAAMYTGASVQSNQVGCASARVPFLELPEDLRKREFESRLIDALSAIIFIAAQASMERKKAALEKRQARKNRRRKRRMKEKEKDGECEEEDTEVPDAYYKGLERKLKLCPAVWWKENPQNIPVMPAEQWEASLEDPEHTGPRIQASITYGTNMQDIRAFVLSNMLSFTAPGGLALLLECVVGIHGEGAVKRMLLKSREKTAVICEEHPCFLVRCTCEARQKKRLHDSSLTLAARRKMTNSLELGHECVSTELISLLLTGKVHSSLDGWTSPLGFGFLSNKQGEVGRALSRPELPVWCVKGNTCYSVLLLDHTNHGDNLDEKSVVSTSTGNDKKKAAEKKKKSLSPSKPKAQPCKSFSLCSSTSRSRDLQKARTFASEDQPGAVANMRHWNPWFGLRNMSGLRLITARPKWTPPAPSWVLAHYKSAPKARHSMSLSCERKSVAQQLLERRDAQTNVVSADEKEGAETEQPIDEAAMERVRLHPDDAKFYPKQHRLWRFDMGESQDAKDPSAKPRGDHWVPYHSLSRNEQMIVETKFGPQINRILWTRWPGATIDKFSPEGKKEPLPCV